MAIVNGYVTLAELKHSLERAALSVVGTTIAFTATPAQITDSASNLLRFGKASSATVRVTGSVANNRDFAVTAGGVNATAMTVSPAPVAGIAGPSITLTDVTDLDDDARLEDIVEAASRAIDKYCRRRFYAAGETRYYAADTPTTCFVDDLLSITTSLKTDDDGDRTYDETWATTDYDLLPFNAVLDGEPYRRIAVALRGTKRFPTQGKGVEIAGSFGYSTTAPDEIREACLLWALRLFARRNTILGVKGGMPGGETWLKIPPPDPDVKQLLAPFVRRSI